MKEEYTYGRDPYLDGLKVRLANRFLEEYDSNIYSFSDEIVNLQKEIQEYIKEND